MLSRRWSTSYARAGPLKFKKPVPCKRKKPQAQRRSKEGLVLHRFMNAATTMMRSRQPWQIHHKQHNTTQHNTTQDTTAKHHHSKAQYSTSQHSKVQSRAAELCYKLVGSYMRVVEGLVQQLDQVHLQLEQVSHSVLRLLEGDAAGLACSEKSK